MASPIIDYGRMVELAAITGFPRLLNGGTGMDG